MSGDISPGVVCRACGGSAERMFGKVCRRCQGSGFEPPDRPAPQVICAKATGCEHAQEDGCPADTFRRRRENMDKWRCPVTGEPVEWREP